MRLTSTYKHLIQESIIIEDRNQAKALFIGNILATFFQLLIPVVLTRIISKTDFGIFRQFTLIATSAFR